MGNNGRWETMESLFQFLCQFTSLRLGLGRHRDRDAEVMGLLRAALYLGDKVGTVLGRRPCCPLAWGPVFCDSLRIGAWVCPTQVIEFYCEITPGTQEGSMCLTGIKNSKHTCHTLQRLELDSQVSKGLFFYGSSFLCPSINDTSNIPRLVFLLSSLFSCW